MSAIRCPHCDAKALVCAHHQPSPLVRNEWHRCVNLECGHTFLSVTQVHYTVTPSETPEPAVSLPLSRHIHGKVRGADGKAMVTPSVKADLLRRPLILAVVADRTGLKKSDIFAGRFPSPAGMKGQALVWNEEAVEAFIAARAAREPNQRPATA